MTKQNKSKFDRITWIVTELIIGFAASGYGVYGLFKGLPEQKILHIIISSIGVILLLLALTQILIFRAKKKKAKKVKHCPKCGAEVQKGDEHCRKCGEKLN
ncbi:MAG: zinc ribbon domain-containing protein [Candidatus Heimdallarchaeaceae archaeon]